MEFLCKVDFYYYEKLLFEKGKCYKITRPLTIDGKSNTIYLYYNEKLNHKVWLPTSYINKYFYTMEELREMKLNNII